MHHPLDVSLFITDVFASIGRGNGVTTVATPFPSQSSPIPVRSTVAALPVNDDERKSGHMLAGDNLDHRGSPMATSAERMAATRARRRAGLVRFVVTLPIAEPSGWATKASRPMSRGRGAAPLHQRHDRLHGHRGPRPEGVTAQQGRNGVAAYQP